MKILDGFREDPWSKFISCELCGSVVGTQTDKRDYQSLHAEWHQKLEKRLINASQSYSGPLK